MHPKLNIWLISLLGACFLGPVYAQRTKPITTPGVTVPSRPAISPIPSGPTASPAASTNTVMFRDSKRLESAPQPPATLEQLSVQLSGTLSGQPPNVSIAFVLLLENNGQQEVTILDPLEFLSLQFTTMGSKLIDVPKRMSKFMVKHAGPGTKRDAPYPAPVQFRQILRINGLSPLKEETITILPGAKIQIAFESEPVVMENVIQALRTESGDAAKSFKARAIVSLVAAPAQPGVSGRLLDADWITFTIPSLD
ncbi:MAG: hypothetical protein WAO00_05545 [Chthoniobacterales bacterium]